jgi:glucose/arabinose dehydrogenase
MKSPPPLCRLPRVRALDLVLGLLLLAVGLGAPRVGYSAAQLLPGFGESLVAEGLNSPTAMAFAPDGRLFVCEQGGQLRVVKNGLLLPTPFLAVDANDSGERGLLGVAFDPNFETEPYVYVYYTAAGAGTHNRVSRFTAAGDVAVPDSELVLLELPPLVAVNHNGGALHFGPDDLLYVAVGENAQPELAPSLESPLGKILRLNRDGTVPGDNPFLAQTVGVNQLIWATGLRNPFTFAFQPGTGLMFINDVGQNKWEEVNTGAPGADYGWPSTEGPTTKPGITGPTFAYRQNDDLLAGCAITGGVFYNPVVPRFPAQWTGRYFFADYCGGYIASFNPANPGAGASLFALELGAPVDLHLGPDGALYYLSRNDSAVWRIDYVVDAPPTITAQPVDRLVSEGRPATFRVSASGAPPLEYEWLRNDVPIPDADEATYTLPEAELTDTGDVFRCRVTNGFGDDLSNPAVLTVTENVPPVPTIQTPLPSLLYRGGDTIAFTGSASDLEDGTVSVSTFVWRVDFHHDEHTHPHMPDTVGVAGGSFAVPAVGETASNVWFRIHLQVTDSAGLVGSTFRDVFPRKADITLASIPTGVELTLDGQPVTAPHEFEGVAGIQRSLGAPAAVSFGENDYQFDSWSQGGARQQTLSTPQTDTTLTALFRLQNGAPTGLQATAVSGVRANLTWSDNSDEETGFSIERRAGTGPWAEVGTVGANAESFTDDGLTPDSSFTYRVRAVVDAQGTVASNEAPLTTPKAGKLKITPGKLTFGTVPKTGKTKSLTLKNTGKGPLPVTVATMAAPFTVKAGSGSAILPPNGKRTVTVRLLPPKPGTFAGTLVINSDDPNKRVANVAATGKRK